MKSEKRKPAELYVPLGYTFEELYDTDDSEFEEEPILKEEVNIVFESGRKN